MPIIIGNTTEETLIWADTAGQVTDEATYGAAIDKVFGVAARSRILELYPFKCVSKHAKSVRSGHDGRGVHLKEPQRRSCPFSSTERTSLSLPVQSSAGERPSAEGTRGGAHRRAPVSVRVARILPADRRRSRRVIPMAMVIQNGRLFLTKMMHISRSARILAHSEALRAPIVISGTARRCSGRTSSERVICPFGVIRDRVARTPSWAMSAMPRWRPNSASH
jgi:hypothetical protein